MQRQLLPEFIDPEDLDIFRVVDSPADAVSQVRKGIKRHWWKPLDADLHHATGNGKHRGSLPLVRRQVRQHGRRHALRPAGHADGQEARPAGEEAAAVSGPALRFVAGRPGRFERPAAPMLLYSLTPAYRRSGPPYRAGEFRHSPATCAVDRRAAATEDAAPCDALRPSRH